MTAPMGRRAHAVSVYKRKRKRRQEVSKRSGRQVTTASYTRHIQATHAHAGYAAININGFTVREDMQSRMEKTIEAGKPNKSVGHDGVHTEMLQVDPDGGAELLRAWWVGVSRVTQFLVE